MAGQFDAIYGRKLAIIAAVLCHFLGWLGSAASSWLAYHLLGAPITPVQALGIEALLRAALSMTFFVPGAAGVQEAAFAGLGAIFGLPADISVAVSLLTQSAGSRHWPAGAAAVAVAGGAVAGTRPDQDRDGRGLRLLRRAPGRLAR